MKVFVEIGVGYENTLRSLIDQGWYGVMVEPQQDALDKIESHKNLFKECLAIHTSEGSANFVGIDDIFAFTEPIQVQGMFGLQDVPTPIHGDSYEGHRLVTQVKTMRLDTLIKKYRLTEIDLLKIDIEGNDVPVLLDYSFVVKPKIIKFEHVHYSGKIYDASAAGFNQKQMTQDYYLLLQKLSDLGYVIWEEERDVYCVR